MNQAKDTCLFLVRIAMGWLFTYAGFTKIVNPDWSAAGYLKSAKTFPEFFGWLAQPEIIPVVNFLNEWGLFLLGLSLLLGIGLRVSTVLGAVLMFLYYLVPLQFPYPNEHSYLVDEHIIYALVLIYLGVMRAGKHWGLAGFLHRNKFLNFLKKID